MAKSAFIEWVQMRLTSHGYPCGRIDGYDGPLTRAAIKAVEKAHGLPENGTVDPDVVDILRLDPGDAKSDAEIERLRNPSEAEIQAIDLASLKINAWPRQRDMSSFYGGVGTNQTRVEIPFDMFLAWDKSYCIRTMTLHKKVAASAERVLRVVEQTYSAKEREALGLHLFGGSLNVRKMRGGSAWSMHSWGIAIDFDPERNQLKWGRDRARLADADAQPFWKAWEAEGWLSLGRARNYDFMHVQAARL
jgi:hypothetical protein